MLSAQRDQLSGVADQVDHAAGGDRADDGRRAEIDPPFDYTGLGVDGDQASAGAGEDHPVVRQDRARPQRLLDGVTADAEEAAALLRLEALVEVADPIDLAAVARGADQLAVAGDDIDHV